MTTLELYRKHKNGEVSREKFLYEVRRDNNLPFITNLTSYDDAVKILKNKGIVTEVETKEAKADEAVKAEVKAKAPSTKKPDSLHIDYANPYEYRHGLQYELNELGEYTDEALEKAKSTVLKNLAKDANFYSNLLNQDQSSYKFKQTETDKPGMQAKADGYLKKELKKDEKANVQDSLGKKEAGKKKPKGVKVMPDKGVTGSQKTIKEGFEVNQDDDQIEISADSGDYVGFIENGKVSFSVVYDEVEDKFGEEGITEDNWKDVLGPNHAFVKIIDTIGGDVEALDDYVQITVDADKLLNSNIKENLEEIKGNKYIVSKTDEDGEKYLAFNDKAVADYLKSVIDPEEIESVDSFMFDDSEGWEETVMNGVDSDAYENMSEEDVEELATSEMSYYLFSKPDEFPFKEMNEHHNDPNFPGGNKIHAMLDKVADEWGKDSDVYSDLEDAIVGWSDRNGELSPKGILAIKNLLSNWDMLDDYEQFLGETVEEEFRPGVDLGKSFEKFKDSLKAEDEFEALMQKYDWYAEMSDDPRHWNAQQSMEYDLKQLAKQMGVDRAVDLYNQYAPSDRKITSSHFMFEDKHAKIKEALKKALKEEDPQLTIANKGIEKKEQELAALRIQQANILKKPGTQS